MSDTVKVAAGLSSVPLELTAILGSTKMKIEDVLKLGDGSIVELQQDADSLVDLMAGEKVLARGKVVDVDGDYGIQIVEILN